MADITIYTGLACGFCERAKLLFTQKGFEFHEINVGLKPEYREEMIARSNGGRTVPQIFINDQYVGGCDELYALERAGKLDEMLVTDETIQALSGD